MPRPVSAALLGAFVLIAGPAWANEFCDGELAPMVKERTALTSQLQAINKNAKRPGAREKFCSTMGAYIGNLNKFVKYLEQNREFCGVPEQFLDQAKKGLGRAQSTRKRVCTAAAQPRPQGPPGQPAAPRPPVQLRLQ